MVSSCCVHGCTNRKVKGKGLQFYRLPLGNKKLLKKWCDMIRCKNLPINDATRICSAHFIDNRKKSKTEVPSIFLWQRKPKPRPTKGMREKDYY